MKLHRLFFAFSFLLAAFQFCYLQEKPKAVLVTEIKDPNCEILLAMMDYLFVELNKDSSSKGYVVIYGKRSALRLNLTYELWANGAVASRNYDRDRIFKVRGTEAENLKIQLWKVPEGAEKPAFSEAKWNFVFSPNTKPFIFYNNLYDQICSYASFEKAFAEYLEANPKARGHIVIYEKSQKKYLEQKKEVQKLLSAIPQNRLRFFQVKSHDSNVEYWLVPKN